MILARARDPLMRACCLLAALVASTHGADAQQVAVAPRVRMTIQQARVHLDAGNAQAAAAQYDSVVVDLRTVADSPERSRLLASALFGRASAHQQQIAGDPDSGATRVALQQQAVADYQEAEQLDSTRFAGAAPNNIGIVLRDAGRHREALTAFQRATRSRHAARAVFFVHAAGEYVTLGFPDSAIAAYRAALRIDSTLTTARGGLLETMLAAYPPDSMITVATRWSVNPTHGVMVTDALYRLLQTRSRAAGLPDTALSLLVVNFATMGLGPADLLRDHESRLIAAAPCDSTLAPDRRGANGAMLPPSPLCAPVRELLQLARAADTRYPRTFNRKFAGTAWWTSSVDRLAVWSMLLRSFAAHYDGNGHRRLAVAYYEAALARPWTNGPPPPWMDIESIAPMAMLYGQSAADKRELDDLLNGVFLGKSVAYQQDDVAKLRRMHTALAAFFVARNEWVGGARGALFQLERMHSMTTRLNASRPANDGLVDPPDLLNELRLALCRVGRTADAEKVFPQVVAGYQRMDRAAGAPNSVCDGAAEARLPRDS
ncbi:MAG: tetratricopeptide repeat protein [Gemmatimonadaceae bacterium]|nr:tetratricopeptide repeat protein [Gemmatimonadaceae bacterium]